MTTCELSQPSLFPGCEPKPLEESTSSAEGSPAKTSPSPGKGRDSAGPDRGFGLSAPGLWASFDPVGHCLRMSVLSSSEGLTGCVRTWRATATPSGRFWWVLASGSERLIDGSESGLSDDWQTPNTLTGGQTSRGGDRKGELLLGGQVRRWPTATVGDGKASGTRTGTPKAQSTASHSGTSLTDAANGLWASPLARDWKDSGPTQGARKSPNLGTQAHAGLLDQGSHSGSGKSRDLWNTPTVADLRPGRNPETLETRGHWGTGNNTGNLRDDVLRGKSRGVLNSKWVAQLMGYPSDWCELPSDVLDALTAKPSKPTGTR